MVKYGVSPLMMVDMMLEWWFSLMADNGWWLMVCWLMMAIFYMMVVMWWLMMVDMMADVFWSFNDHWWWLTFLLLLVIDGCGWLRMLMVDPAVNQPPPPFARAPKSFDHRPGHPVPAITSPWRPVQRHAPGITRGCMLIMLMESIGGPCNRCAWKNRCPFPLIIYCPSFPSRSLDVDAYTGVYYGNPCYGWWMVDCWSILANCQPFWSIFKDCYYRDWALVAPINRCRFWDAWEWSS